MRIVLLAALVACSSSAPTSTTTVTTPARPAGDVRAADPQPPPLRLPGDVAPTKYRLELTLVPTADKVDGSVHIDARVVRATRVVWLNATDLAVTHATLGDAPARVIPGGEDFVGLTTDAELPVGPLTIDVAFKAGIDRDKARGIYAQKEGETGETYAYTFFEPIDARRAFPCFDEPNYKVPWTLVFHVKKDHVALANAPAVKETDEPNGMKRVEIAESKPLPSYLVAFVVGPFDLVDGGTAGRIKTPIRFIVPKGRANELGYAKEVTPKVLVALESYFDMDYPYIKLDVAVVPRFWGTMEHPGIVAMGQPLTLIRPEEASRNRRQSYTNILAHEMSHYWFGDLVTMKWWDDTWLNEALGEWSDVNITEAAEPSWKYRDDRYGNSAWAMEADEKLTAGSIRRKIDKRADIQASFDNAITYAKGSSVFRMLEAYVGRDHWRDFIHAYLTKHAWGNATADDFLADMGTSLGADIADAAHTFLDQPGVPLVEATARCGATNTITLRQTRALPFGVTDPSDKQWKIPVCMRVGDAKGSSRVCKLLDKREDTIAVKTCPTWIVPNDDGNGYYRSKIDDALAKREFGKTSGASMVEKAMSLMDLGAAIGRGELTIDKSFAMAPFALGDADDRVQAFAWGMTSFATNGVDDNVYKALVSYHQTMFLPLARKLGWQRRPNDSDDRNRLRGEIVGSVAKYDEALGKEAEAIADKWVDTHSGIDNDLVGRSLYIAAYRGDSTRFERYLAGARAARDRQVQQRLLGQLGSFRSPELARRALGLVLDGGFDLRDSLTILWDVLGNREHRDLGLAWVKEHIDELLAKQRDDEKSWFLSGLSEMYCDPARRKIAEELVTPRMGKIDGAENYVKRSLESSEQCIAQVARQLPALKTFLKIR